MVVVSSRLVCCLGAAAVLLMLPACAAQQLATPTSEQAPRGEARTDSLPQITQVAAFEDSPRNEPAQPTGPAVPDWFDAPRPPEKSAPLVALPEATDWLKAPAPDCWSRMDADLDLGVDDFKQFYSWPNLGMVALGVGAAAPIANTKADQHFRNWYQDRVYNKNVDPYANALNYAGQLWVVVPVGLEACALGGMAGDNYASDGGVYEWANRSLRAAAVGYPTVIGLFVALGAKRADQNDSYWHPFNDVHGVSGHAFIGAIPFMTAAAMTDDPCWQVPLLLGSMAEGWTRIHMDRHYLSQVIQGWWLAYLSVKAVDATQSNRRSMFTVAPTIGPDGAGMLLQVQF
jgi:hypothetical protein